METKIAPNPVRLRPATECSIGTTAFFRNRPLFDTLLNRLKDDGGQSYKVLFHACSIGAEVYSLIVQYLLQQHNKLYQLECLASDREGGFLDFAMNGKYPKVVDKGMSDLERSFFETINDGLWVKSDVKKYVEFLPPTDFTNCSFSESYDVVILLNALVYVSEKIQHQVLANIAKYNSRYLVLSAFHANTIKGDLEKNGYLPILDRQELIHDSWLDRRVEKIIGDVRTPQVLADWRLPPFSRIDDYEYKYCAIFEKQH